ncbi:MAG: CHRD domain-containing protein [Bacteroidia bacterium]|nr:CHRD domain-containing protein [Bacteroidia bacterium]
MVKLPAPLFFISELTGDQEVPGVDTDAEGKAYMRLERRADSTLALDYIVEVNGLDFGPLTGQAPQTEDSGDDAIMMHIHNAMRGVNGPVVFGIRMPNQDDNDLKITINADGSATSRLLGCQR